MPLEYDIETGELTGDDERPLEYDPETQQLTGGPAKKPVKKPVRKPAKKPFKSTKEQQDLREAADVLGRVDATQTQRRETEKQIAQIEKDLSRILRKPIPQKTQPYIPDSKRRSVAKGFRIINPRTGEDVTAKEMLVPPAPPPLERPGRVASAVGSFVRP